MDTWNNSSVKTFLFGYLLVLIIEIALLFIFEKGDLVVLLNHNASAFFDEFFKLATLLGLGGVFVVPIIFSLFIRYSYSIGGFLSLLFTGLFTYLGKQVLFNGMPRPTAYFQNHELQHFIGGFEYHSLNSFPSGHTMTAFALAFFIVVILNKKSWSIPILIIATIIGMSRMYLLQHFLMDVIAGSFLGLICTYFGFVISKSFERKFPFLINSVNFTLTNRKK